VIKKVVKLMNRARKIFLKVNPSAISRVQAKSTVAGRKKVDALKKIGRNIRNNKKNIFI